MSRFGAGLSWLVCLSWHVCLQPPNKKAKKSSIFSLNFCVLLFLCIFFAFYRFFVCDAPINSRHRHPLVSSQTSQEAPESIFCLVAASWNIFLVNQPMIIAPLETYSFSVVGHNRTNQPKRVYSIHSKSEKVCGTAFSVKKICGKSA